MGHSAPKIVNPEGIAEEIGALLGSMLIETIDHADELTFVVARDDLANAMVALRDMAHYQQLMEIAGVDYPERPDRFEVAYHLLSVTRNHRVRVKVSTDEDTPVPTVTHLWPVAGWLEREVFDMYGVIFDGNTDLRRILTDYGFKGHPQRKDFPLTGFVELRYSEEAKRVVYEPVELAQDFRTFDFMSPWEGAKYVLPGDEKAPDATPAPQPEAKGAPTPLKAAEIAKGTEEKTPPQAEEPKTSDDTTKTGVGQPHPGNQPQDKPADPDVVPPKDGGQNQ